MSQQTPRRYPKHKRNPSANRVSDYESDAPYVVDTTPNPKLANRTNTEVNLKVIRSYLPDVNHINYCNANAVVYGFNTAQSEWMRTNIDGPLFVCQSGTSGATVQINGYIFILNRKNTENRVYSFRNIIDIDITSEYLILIMDEPGNDAVGIWVHAANDADRIASMNKIRDVIMEVKNAASPSASASSAPPPVSGVQAPLQQQHQQPQQLQPQTDASNQYQYQNQHPPHMYQPQTQQQYTEQYSGQYAPQFQGQPDGTSQKIDVQMLFDRQM
ncbi:Dcp1-like decapping family protein [Ceratocystis lukuohia]|uniref:mRNA-decapping enzyme-like protein n=2 Tax=Ceratocystis TaxID=5157 RepID=A0A2C5XAE3_9PEZI|nr:hypothetical protein CFIMG_003040RA [Ceratocystis fimbriata CBS 114723]